MMGRIRCPSSSGLLSNLEAFQTPVMKVVVNAVDSGAEFERYVDFQCSPDGLHSSARIFGLLVQGEAAFWGGALHECLPV